MAKQQSHNLSMYIRFHNLHTSSEDYHEVRAISNRNQTVVNSMTLLYYLDHTTTMSDIISQNTFRQICA